MSSKIVLLLVLLGSVMNIQASTISQIAAGLGYPSGITFLQVGFLDSAVDADDFWYHTSETTTSKWTVSGGTVYAALTENYDAARLYITVTGPGTLAFEYQVSIWDSDVFTWYLDGNYIGSDFSFWPDPEWIAEEIEIISGKNLNQFQTDDPEYSLNVNNRYFDTGTHVIVFEYWRGEDSKAEYLEAKPVLADYDDREDYNEDYYYWKSLENKVFIRNLVWTPTPLTFALSQPDGTEFDNSTTIGFAGNFADFGYEVRYTLDGTPPTASNGLVYDHEAGIILDSPCLVWGRAFSVTGGVYTQMGEAKANYLVRVAQPTIAVSGEEDHGLRITLACLTAGASIRYTLDGSIPGENGGILYAAPFLLSSAATLTAQAFKENFTPSNAATSQYVQVAAPTFQVRDDNFALINDTIIDPAVNPLPIVIIMNCETSGAEIRYTSDGTIPGRQTQLYDPFFPPTSQQNITLKVRAYLPGADVPVVPSPEVSLRIYITDQQMEYKTAAEGGYLRQGWNALGLDLLLPIATREALLQALPALRGPDGSLITQPEELQAGQAYWLFLTQDNIQSSLPVNVKGALRESIPLKKGWHFLAGKVQGERATQFAWKWNGEKFEIVSLSEWHNMEGGWYYAEDDAQSW